MLLIKNRGLFKGKIKAHTISQFRFLDLKMYVPIFIFKPLYELTTKYLKFFGPPEDFKLIASYDLSKIVPYSFSHVCPKYLLQKISPVHKMFLA